MYKITAIIHRVGGKPAVWVKISDKKLTLSECEKLLMKQRKSKLERMIPVEEICLEHFVCEHFSGERIITDISQEIIRMQLKYLNP